MICNIMKLITQCMINFATKSTIRTDFCFVLCHFKIIMLREIKTALLKLFCLHVKKSRRDVIKILQESSTLSEKSYNISKELDIGVISNI